MRTPVLALTLVALLGAGACAGGDGDEGVRSGLASDVASGLALRAEGVAAAIESGRCDVALTEAQSLQADLAATEMADAVRTEAVAGAARLVESINCPPPTTTTSVTTATTAAPTPPVQNEGPVGKRKKERKGDDNDD